MGRLYEILNKVLNLNEDNSENSLKVDTTHALSTHTEVITTLESDYVLVPVPAGSHIIIESVHLSVAGNVGTVELNLADGTPVDRLYSSNKTTETSLGMALHGSDGSDLLFSGDGATAEILVVVNYKIHS